MKKFFINFILIVSLLFNVFADNKQAHKELREVFESWDKLPIMVEKGFDLDKLDKIDDWKEMRDYLQLFFMDEKGYPLDQHSPIHFYDNKGNYGYVRTQCQMYIDWTDEYGSKKELLKKGFKEDEIFYYPYFNGEWRDGYRVGKKFRCDHSGCYSGYGYDSDIVSTKKSLFVQISSFNKVPLNLDVISKSSKKYLILDFSANCGGLEYNYQLLVDAIKKMKPKEIFVFIDYGTYSMGERAAYFLKKDSSIKTTLIGYPTRGGYTGRSLNNGGNQIKFDNFTIDINLSGNGGKLSPELIEGVGLTPDYYTSNNYESIEIVKHLTNDEDLCLPKPYMDEIIYCINNDIKKWQTWTFYEHQKAKFYYE